MSSGSSSEPDRRASVLFLDVRNFTLLLDNKDPADVTDMLDHLFGRVRDAVEAHGGTVDKIVGDGVMAVFDGEGSGHSAARAAIDVYENAVRETEAQKQFSSIDVGIGIASGPVQRTTIADVDSTVVGRCVNVAARLQGLCKEYQTSILVDTDTFRDLSMDDLPARYVDRLIPDRDLRGIRRSVDTFQICDTHRLDEEYVALFNQGVENFLDQNYDEALSAFTRAYSKDERYADQTLLNRFTNDCLDNLNDDRDLFRNPDRYENHSTTQQQQSMELTNYVRKVTFDWDFSPEHVLDVGCGTGTVTERLAKTFPDAAVVGVDSSRSAIGKARTEHAPEDLEVRYVHSGIENYRPEDELGRYDLIYSNSAMHWVEEQHQAYENLRGLVSEDGLLAVHQGHKGTYKELHEVTIDVLESFGYDHYFDDLTPPLDLIYYDKESMQDLLRRHGFDPYRCKVDDETAPDTIIEDFAEASLNAYCERLENDSQREIFREQFKQRAREEYDPAEVTVRRIYVTAVPN